MFEKLVQGGRVGVGDGDLVGVGLGNIQQELPTIGQLPVTTFPPLPVHMLVTTHDAPATEEHCSGVGDGDLVGVGLGLRVGVGDGEAVGQLPGITTPLLHVRVQPENHISPLGCDPHGKPVGLGDGLPVGVGLGLNWQQIPVVQLALLSLVPFIPEHTS